MLEDPGDTRRVGDRGDDTHLPTAVRTVTEVDRERRGAERCIQLIGAVDPNGGPSRGGTALWSLVGLVILSS